MLLIVIAFIFLSQNHNSMKFEIFQSEKDQQYYFRLKARNGRIMLRSEGYRTKAGCRKGVEAVKRLAGDEDRYIKKVAENKKSYLVLKALNGKVVAQSDFLEVQRLNEMAELLKRFFS